MLSKVRRAKQTIAVFYSFGEVIYIVVIPYVCIVEKLYLVKK